MAKKRAKTATPNQAQFASTWTCQTTIYSTCPTCGHLREFKNATPITGYVYPATKPKSNRRKKP